MSFDRADLGYTGDRDPEKEGISRKKSGQLIDDLVGDVEEHIADWLLPALRAAILQELGEPQHDEWSLMIDEAEAQTLNFHYPVVLPTAQYQGVAYITPRVKLELGARGDPWPAEKTIIRPYAAEDFPDFFVDPDTTVTVLSARRTFWEKATALHTEAHRPAEAATPQYFSRHYYDLAMILASDEGSAAAADLGLLATVAKHKATFFRSGWANYDTARPGTLRLVAARLAENRGPSYLARLPLPNAVELCYRGFDLIAAI
ncbi:nucleotidyl transferase AbiEii/AbiGii toxin family protein [Mesorhizobium sp. SARCC-RB16n]|uniref:nucleotidyl transferase AbiEii/AbiGii toxin family protein n=1 Tax=Mesorhizobium sp. SARCC-RB16n TaxID=2116687 RepID=UPI001FF01C59|nr:nucleotidyl transferase AbiEii/AbiGii toxin family protein [Mesorhizobium sp. SARCC-RB16n]